MTRLLQMLEGRRVAIVGNAPVAKDCSAEIDSADVVVRFNHFYNYASGKVGKRIDIVLQTVAAAWDEAVKAGRANLEVVARERPAIFLVKRPDHYTTRVHAVYGKDIRIDNLAGVFEPWWRFTTGTAALCYLAQNLTNAEVKTYAFGEDNEGVWRDYIRTDAAHYAQVADEERVANRAARAKLAELKITSEARPIPKCIVVPVKANSEGAPGKNRLLLKGCLEKVGTLGLPLFVTGDDYELMHTVRGLAEPVPLPAIGAYEDVTATLRKWQVATGYCGDVALVQCTSPGLRPEWVEACFDALGKASIAATAVELGFKPTAIFREDGGVFVPASQSLPAASVARQLLPRCVRITGAVEAFHTDALACESFWTFGVMEPVMVQDARDVDTLEDLKEALK